MASYKKRFSVQINGRVRDFVLADSDKQLLRELARFEGCSPSDLARRLLRLKRQKNRSAALRQGIHELYEACLVLPEWKRFQDEDDVAQRTPAAPPLAKKDLTVGQQQVLDFISQSIRERGHPPTLREIAEHLGTQTGLCYLKVMVGASAKDDAVRFFQEVLALNAKDDAVRFFQEVLTLLKKFV